MCLFQAIHLANEAYRFFRVRYYINPNIKPLLITSRFLFYFSCSFAFPRARVKRHADKQDNSYAARKRTDGKTARAMRRFIRLDVSPPQAGKPRQSHGTFGNAKVLYRVIYFEKAYVKPLSRRLLL